MDPKPEDFKQGTQIRWRAGQPDEQDGFVSSSVVLDWGGLIPAKLTIGSEEESRKFAYCRFWRKDAPHEISNIYMSGRIPLTELAIIDTRPQQDVEHALIGLGYELGF